MENNSLKILDETILDEDIYDRSSKLAETIGLVPGFESVSRLIKSGIHLFKKSREERAIDFLKELTEYSKINFEKLDPEKQKSGIWRLLLIIRDIDNSDKDSVEKIRAYAHFLSNSYKNQKDDDLFIEDWKIIQSLSFQELVILSSRHFINTIGGSAQNPVREKYPELVNPPSKINSASVTGYGLYHEHSLSNLIAKALLDKESNRPTKLGDQIVLLVDLDGLVLSSKKTPPYSH